MVAAGWAAGLVPLGELILRQRKQPHRDLVGGLVLALEVLSFLPSNLGLDRTSATYRSAGTDVWPVPDCRLHG